MLQLTIVVDSEGYLNITGPVDDKITVLGILELAKAIVLNAEVVTAPVIRDGDTTPAGVLRRKVQES